jgi:hypothetical protein
MSPLSTISLYLESVDEIIDLKLARLSAEAAFRVPPGDAASPDRRGVGGAGLGRGADSYRARSNLLSPGRLVLIFKLASLLMDGLGRKSTGVLQVPQQALLAGS